jgi:SOS-response transcriptional repressor LexA
MITPAALTARQRQVLRLVWRIVRDEGHLPTLREVCRALHTRSPTGARWHLEALRKAGYLERKGFGGSHVYRINGARLVPDDTDAGRRLAAAIGERGSEE